MMNIVLGIMVVLICVSIQASTIAGLLKWLRTLSNGNRSLPHTLFDIVVLSVVTAGLFFGMLLQALVWALAFMWIGEISDFRNAFYFSLVNFTTLGYGDITLSEAHAVLGPMEASNGILMLGLSTSFFYTVAVKLNLGREKAGPSDRG